MKQGSLKCAFQATLIAVVVLCSLHGFAQNNLPADRTILVNHITTYFPEQLTDPQKKNRRNFSQFGYNLSFFRFPLFPITDFINPAKFGIHSYGQPHRKEANGAIYTCRGGFIDVSHIRCAADWAVYLTFKIITDNTDFNLPPEAGSLHLHFQHVEELSLTDLSFMAQKIAFERLLWHEVASWYYHAPNHTYNEQQSAFTPEDIYSNFLGTLIGRNIALRILQNLDTLSYAQIATEEIQKTMASLHPFSTKKQTAQAYDVVDRNKQLKLPVAQRNTDIWWDSKIVFTDHRFMFKRYMNIGPELPPWLVPSAGHLHCPAPPHAEVLHLPQQSAAGVSYYDYYQFTIRPDSTLFYNNDTGEPLHTPFAAFTTAQYAEVIDRLCREIETHLLPGFDTRNSKDPVPSFKKIKTVFFR